MTPWNCRAGAECVERFFGLENTSSFSGRRRMYEQAGIVGPAYGRAGTGWCHPFGPGGGRNRKANPELDRGRTVTIVPLFK